MEKVKQQTAMQWFIKEIQRIPLHHRTEKAHFFYHALKKEREQILEAYNEGFNDRDEVGHEYRRPEQYFTNTYKTKP